MKNFVLILLYILLFPSFVVANEVSFIYLNGSNNNTQKATQWFISGIKKFHPILKNEFDNNKLASSLFLDENETISPEPMIFFWGNESSNDLNRMKKNLSLTKFFSPILAYHVRAFIAECFHDAIWIQKPHNMIMVLNELDNVVKKEQKNNKDVLLIGYSAGSFITNEYLINKLAYINLKTFFETLNASNSLLDYVNKNPKQNSCLHAIAASNFITYDVKNNIALVQDEKFIKKKYDQIDSFTQTYCVEGDKIKGVINYASPFVLFYSELGDPNYKLTEYLKYFYEYIVEHDIFILTVNYRDDPLGFPTVGNLINDDVEKLIGLELSPRLGFIYDYSDRLSLRTTFGAHTSYWATGKRFSNMIVKGFIEGYQYQYHEPTQKELLKKYRNKRR